MSNLIINAVNHRVLIGGGSGLIGSRLTEMLLGKGYEVRHLGRKAKEGPARLSADAVKTFQWDIHKGTMDNRAFEGVSTVINLAGANINDHRWTESFKKEILISRTESTRLIVNFLNSNSHSVTHFLAGSAVGYYGFSNSSHWFHESDPPGNDFMAQVVVQWEKVTQLLKDNQTKVAHIRTGIVIGENTDAIEAMARPINLYVGAPLGSGKQVVSWIHLEDICGIFVHVLENKLRGEFNAAAPEPATNEELTKVLAAKLRKPLWLPNIPGFVLKIVLGEMANAVLNGSKVSSEKIKSTGFKFQYPDLKSALT